MYYHHHQLMFFYFFAGQLAHAQTFDRGVQYIAVRYNMNYSELSNMNHMANIEKPIVKTWSYFAEKPDSYIRHTYTVMLTTSIAWLSAKRR